MKLKLHFYEQRLEKMAPSSVEQALRENIQLKVEFQTLRTELKRYKKLLLDGDKAIQALTAERDQLASTGRRGLAPGSTQSGREKELERRLLEQEEQREVWERKARELHKELKQLRAEGGEAATEVGATPFSVHTSRLTTATVPRSCAANSPTRKTRRTS